MQAGAGAAVTVAGTVVAVALVAYCVGDVYVYAVVLQLEVRDA